MVASAVLSHLHTRGRSVAWLATHAGVPDSTLRSKLDGRSVFTVTDLAAIADALGLSPAALVPSPPAATRPLSR